MIEKKLKYISLFYDEDNRILTLSGDNKFVSGVISIKYCYLYSVLVFINRIFRMRRKK